MVCDFVGSLVDSLVGCLVGLVWFGLVWFDWLLFAKAKLHNELPDTIFKPRRAVAASNANLSPCFVTRRLDSWICPSHLVKAFCWFLSKRPNICLR